MPVFHRSPLVAAGLAAALALAACRAQDPPAAETSAPAADAWEVTVEPLALPAAGRSGQPHLTASSRGVLLSWLEHDDATATLKFAEWTPGGWSDARTVAASDGWFVSAADVPTVLRLRDGTLVATRYPAVDPAIEAYNTEIVRSRDDGRTWSAPVTPHHDGTTTQHGFASLYERADGGLGVIWLDGRDQELNTTAPDGGAMSLYHGAFDPSGRQIAEQAIDGRVCECCQTAVAMTADGPIAVFRDRSPREIRDIHVSRLEGETWTQARPVHVDGWQIDACPVNGPAVSADGPTVAVAWFSAAGDQPRAYAAFSADAGRTWGEPIRLDDASSLGHVEIELLGDGSAVASWLEFANQRAQLRLRRVWPSGARSAPIVLAGEGAGFVSGYPRLARRDDAVVAVWTESARDAGLQAFELKGAVVRSTTAP